MIRAIVTDIEGTTSSLSFVKDVLFPYSRARMADFVHAHKDEPEVASLLDKARQAAGGGFDNAQVTEQLVRWIDEDKKLTPLKALQGMIWEEGYLKGDFQGHVYDDAVRQLKHWHAAGILLYVFSSGSVHAQKLLFSHTDHGDLTPLFSAYFDTCIGPKREMASYEAIARAIGLEAGDILFLSDVAEELEAAARAGMQTRWVVREGTLRSDSAFVQVVDFDAIDLGEESDAAPSS